MDAAESKRKALIAAVILGLVAVGFYVFYIFATWLNTSP
jgi:hypothetical protein